MSVFASSRAAWAAGGAVAVSAVGTILIIAWQVINDPDAHYLELGADRHPRERQLQVTPQDACHCCLPRTGESVDQDSERTGCAATVSGRSMS